MAIIEMTNLDLAGKRVLIREDLNVPLKDGKVASDLRIKASLPTIKLAIDAGAKVMLMSHLGRPKEGEFDTKASLAPVAEHLEKLLGQPVKLVQDWLNQIDINAGEVVLCENVRFNKGEKNNDDELSKKMAALCDIYVMDAFGTAHRAQASTHGVAKYAPIACAGPLLAGELEALGKALDNPDRPMVAIVGGSKVSTKLTVLESLSKVVDQLIVGGGIANTFIAAAGYKVGKSLHEPSLIYEAKKLSAAAQSQGGDIPVPTDVVVGKTSPFEQADATATLKSVTEVTDDEMIFDVGPKTSAKFTKILKTAGTIVWNGPVGVFEMEPFSKSTEELAIYIAGLGITSIIGGGDTASAVRRFKVADQMSHVSTGGGASLELLEGLELPGIKALKDK
jgi:phosphoglycerate kinase